MKLCCDENIKRSITNLLEQEGYDVVRVQDELELGFEYNPIVRFCRENHRVLLTNDDFFEFVYDVGELAEQEGHHPDIFLEYGASEVKFWTHKIDGLHEADFVMAAKVDEIREEYA